MHTRTYNRKYQERSHQPPHLAVKIKSSQMAQYHAHPSYARLYIAISLLQSGLRAKKGKVLHLKRKTHGIARCWARKLGSASQTWSNESAAKHLLHRVLELSIASCRLCLHCITFSQCRWFHEIKGLVVTSRMQIASGFFCTSEVHGKCAIC